MIPAAVAGILAGIAGHQTRRYTKTMASGWSNLLEHGIVVALLFPFVLMFHNALKTQQEGMRLPIAYILASLFVGIGVAIGWFADGIHYD